MARQTYEKSYQEWKNKPDETTPILAENLNHIEEGIKTAMDDRAQKEIYDDSTLNLGRVPGSTVGYRSAAIGSGNRATNDRSVAIGDANTSSGVNSIATGSQTKAAGNDSFTAGYYTEASGSCSFAIGRSAIASAENSFAYGRGTISEKEAQIAGGKYNESVDGAVIIGNGTYNERKNIYVLDWNGNIKVLGDVTTEFGASLNEIGKQEDVDIDFSNYFT